MRIGIISDIHEDIDRLELALKKMEKAGVDQIACLGDIVGFDVLNYRYLANRSASRCLDAVRENCRWVVAGNHDLFAIRKLPEDCGPFRYPANWYELDYQERKELAQNKVWLYEQRELPALLTKQDRCYIASLPLHSLTEVDGVKMVFTHSLTPDLTGSLSIRPQDPWDFKPHFSWLKSLEVNIGVSGHLHLNGLAVATPKNYKILGFGSSTRIDNLVQYICPCTANSSSKNGFLLLDTRHLTLTAQPLKSKPYVMDNFR